MMREIEDDADKFIFKKLTESMALELVFVPHPFHEFAWILHHPTIGDIFIDSNYERTREFISSLVHEFILSVRHDIYMVSIANFMIFLTTKFSELGMAK